MKRTDVVRQIKEAIRRADPTAETILFGSEARGEAKKDSDIDILILVNEDYLSPQEEDRITSPIYDLEIETGTIISPIVMTRKDWEASQRRTIFYYNVMKDGTLL